MITLPRTRIYKVQSTIEGPRAPAVKPQREREREREREILLGTTVQGASLKPDDGPTVYSNWVVPGRVMVGAYPGMLDDKLNDRNLRQPFSPLYLDVVY